MNNSIRKSFYVIIALVIAFFLCVFICFTQIFLIGSINESYEFYNYTLKSVETNINKSMNRIWKMNESIIYNDNLQELIRGNYSVRNKTINEINSCFNAYRTVDENLKYVAVSDMNGEYYDFLSNSSGVELSAAAKKILNNYNGSEAAGELYFFTLPSDDENNRYFALLTPIYQIGRMQFYYKKQIGKAISIYSQELLLQTVRSVSYEIVDKIVIADSDDIIRLTQTQGLADTKIEQETYSDKIVLKYGGMSLYSKPFDLYAGELSRSLIFMLITVLVVLLISLLIINYWFKRYVVADVTEILGVLKDNQSGSAKKRIKVKHHNEFSDIAENINAMLDGIEEYNSNAFYGQQRLYEMEIQLNKMQIYMLKGQVNPHFLYNTLGCIRSLALEEGMDNIVSISEATISLLRYNLKEKGHVTLGRELEECEKYIRIINTRYENIVQFECNIQKEALDAEVLKMIIQPILENSVYHGMFSHDTILHIDIKAYIKDEVLHLSVADDGIGMDEEKLASVNRMIKSDENVSEHIGLYNVNKRIVMEYGSEYGIDIASQEGQGCIVNIRIPVKKDEKIAKTNLGFSENDS